tara:strand:+ start:3695 stop:3931 length:237 start_codon:yes stop_codon:yes gene_type:complete
MRKLSEELVDESYKSIKDFTKNSHMTQNELSELDKFVKNMQSLIDSITEKKEKLELNKLGNEFKELIKNGINDVERNS